MAKKTAYNAKHIDVLSDLEAVRAKANVYVGSLDSFGMWICLREIIDNSRDEASDGHASTVYVERLGEYEFVVYDNGRGIPVDPHPKHKLPGIQLVFCRLHAGGKMKNGEGSVYTRSGGVHGMGACITTALSAKLEAYTYRNGWHSLHCENGEFKKFGKASSPKGLMQEAQYFENAGTLVKFTIDHTLFDGAIDADRVIDYLELMADFYPRINFVYVDKLGVEVFCNKQSLAAKVAKGLGLVAKDVLAVDASHVQAALAFSRKQPIKDRLHVCGMPTPDLGTHWTGFLKALELAVAPHVKKQEFTAEDLAASLSGVLLLELSTPKFNGQTKQRLESRDAVSIVRDALKEPLAQFFAKHKPQLAEAIKRAEALHAMERRHRAEKELDKSLTTSKGKLNLPPKLVIAPHCHPDKREVYVVEGDSALGCFTGDTLVQLINGETKSMIELVADAEKGIVNYGYSHWNTSGIHVVPITQPRLVKYTKLLTEVVLDNGKKIRCTRNHEWKLRDGSYCDAQDLQSGDSIMPHYEKIYNAKHDHSRHGRRMVSHPGFTSSGKPSKRNCWEFVHQIVARDIPILRKQMQVLSAKGDIPHIHHRDLGRTNDHPANLQILSERKHRALHASLLRVPWGKGEDNLTVKRMKDRQQRRIILTQLREAKDEYWCDSPDSSKHKEEARQRALQQMSDPARRNQISKSVKDWWNKDRRAVQAERARKQSSDPAFQEKRRIALFETRRAKFLHIIKLCKGTIDAQTFERVYKEWMLENNVKREPFGSGFEAWREFYPSLAALKRATARTIYNHKVAYVRNIVMKNPVPVYDASIDVYHNYALAAGVYVHNTAKQARDFHTQEVMPLLGKIMNVVKNDGKVVNNAVVQDLLRVIGYRSDDRKMERARVRGKIIFLTDADADGGHIQLLLVGMMHKYLPHALKSGMVHIVDIPLFSYKSPDEQAFGNSIAEIKEQVKHFNPSYMSRAKGWGACSPEHLSKLAFDPKTRKLIRLTPIRESDQTQFYGLLTGDTSLRRQMLTYKKAGKQSTLRTRAIKRLRAALPKLVNKAKAFAKAT